MEVKKFSTKIIFERRVGVGKTSTCGAEKIRRALVDIEKYIRTSNNNTLLQPVLGGPMFGIDKTLSSCPVPRFPMARHQSGD